MVPDQVLVSGEHASIVADISHLVQAACLVPLGWVYNLSQANIDVWRMKSSDIRPTAYTLTLI